MAAAGSCEARGPLSAHTLLFDLPPALLGELCAVLDSCDGALGWRGLGAMLNLSDQILQEDRFPNRPAKETANATVDEVIMPEHNEKGILLKPSISFQNIIEGTQNFHKDFLVGEGEIFQVFRVVLQNRTYAVKLFKQDKKMQCKKQWKRFLSELEVLLLFHHPNILELAAYCIETEQLCLVYPYMRNGSLFDRLQCVGDTIPLSWHIRISLLVGTCKAIQYLHNIKPCAVVCGSISRVIAGARYMYYESTAPGGHFFPFCFSCCCHWIGQREIKKGGETDRHLQTSFTACEATHCSTNILLDDQFQPKLTDFVMAHFQPHLEHQSTTISLTTSNSKRLWYLPEEYIRQGKLSIKTDIYSFGIVIMEVLTGCKVVLDDPKHIQLRDLLMELMERRGLDACLSFLDKKVHPCPRNFSAKLFSLAGQCAATRAKVRPSMDEVQTTLESAQVSLYFAEDPPTSLKSFRCPSPLFLDNIPSIPMEDDEDQKNHALAQDNYLRKDRMSQKTPLECSQSEVTFLSFDRKTGSKRNEDTCSVPSSCEESEFSKQAAPPQNSSVDHLIMDPTAETPDHSYSSRPETSCSSGFLWSECDPSKKESSSHEEKGKCFRGN
ncbi:interleukin-1 receptor-associated kinase 3 isoform X3 [Erinaceus europaeus]|uniref:Interleukin-1 receptor-associated kinase 3 isoform X3 n=1 Tax=Erinaceus europaeus TaxID=9365 RepID=A0ABM3XQ69_ERIEU|nr:interleukin-1 receptor-associated kinase 3 isoform X3 [Erinaceus europaeus]